MPAQFTARAADGLATIQQQLDLPAFLVAWYAIASPQDFEIPTLGNPQWLEPPENLADALLGYRYLAHSSEVLPGWDAPWLVLGGEPEYPLIVQTAAAHDTAIYHGQPGEATWGRSERDSRSTITWRDPRDAVL